MPNQDNIQIPAGYILVTILIEPKSPQDEYKFAKCLSRLKSDDPSFQLSFDEDKIQAILGGVSYQHLETGLEYLNRESKIELKVGKPQIGYRETVVAGTEYKYLYTLKTIVRRDATGGAIGMYAKIGAILRSFKGIDKKRDFRFVENIPFGLISSEFYTHISMGIKASMKSGVLTGYPVIGVEVELVDGDEDDEDVITNRFVIAGQNWFSAVMLELESKNQLCLLEPIMHVEIVTADHYKGELINHLHSLRAIVAGVNPGGDGRVILQADVPLAEMLDFATGLHERTQGTGTFSMSPAYFEKVPDHIFSTIDCPNGCNSHLM